MRFFKTPTHFRRWLAANHARESELLVGFYKKASGKPSMTWEESVDEALCFGWIDGLRKRLDGISYTIRFTPRKPTSIWSAVNIRRVQELSHQGLMQPAGIAAFAKRNPIKSGVYAYENHIENFDALTRKKFRSNKRAWMFFQSQALSYRKLAMRWVMGAKQVETKNKRLAILIKESAQGKRLEMTTKWSKRN